MACGLASDGVDVELVPHSTRFHGVGTTAGTTSMIARPPVLTAGGLSNF